MDFRLKAFLATLIVSLVMFAWLIYVSLTNEQMRPIPSAAQQGKLVFQRKACIECHTVLGNGGYYGGDLTKVYEKLGNDGLQEFLTHPPLISGAKQKRHKRLSEAETKDMIAYLEFLDSIHTANWPPQPLYQSKPQAR